MLSLWGFFFGFVPINFSDPSGHRPSDGCDYEGCRSEKSEAEVLLNYYKYNDPYFLNPDDAVNDSLQWIGEKLGQGIDKIATSFGFEPPSETPSGLEVCLASSNCYVDIVIPSPPTSGGLARAQAHSEYWTEASLNDAVSRIAGENPIITYTQSCKTIYQNPTNGMQVVYDNAGNYFRIHDPNATGRAAYTDLNGNMLPDNVYLVHEAKTIQTGLPRKIWQSLTHFLNID